MIVSCASAGAGCDVFVKIAENIANAIKGTIHIGDHELQLGASIGIADFREHGDDADSLVRNSAAAMRIAHYQRSKHARSSLAFCL